MEFKDYFKKLQEGKIPPQFLKNKDKKEEKEPEESDEKDEDSEDEKKEDKGEKKSKFPFKKKEDLKEASDSFKIVYRDGRNMTFLIVSNKGTSLRAVNQSERPVALSNLAFMITLGEFKKAGFDNSGKKDQEAYVKDSVHIAYNASKGNPEKFAKEFSKLMKLTFNFVESDDFNESEEDLEESYSYTHTWTKEELIEFISELEDEEVQEVGDFLMSELMEDEEFEDDDFETGSDEDEESDVSEAHFFDKKKSQIDREKKKNVSQRKMKARLLKKYYKKNKAKIARKAKIYRKKAKRNPNKVFHHKGV